MIKTIDTEVVTLEMETAMRGVFVRRFLQAARAFDRGITDDQANAGWDSSRQGYIEHVRAALEAAPEVKAGPVAYTNKYQLDLIAENPSGYVFKMWGESGSAHGLPLYLHPPRLAADVVERIRALRVTISGFEPNQFNYGWNQAIEACIELIEGAK